MCICPGSRACSQGGVGVGSRGVSALFCAERVLYFVQSRGPGHPGLGCKGRRCPCGAEEVRIYCLLTRGRKQAQDMESTNGRERGASFIPKRLAWSCAASSLLSCFGVCSRLQPFLCLLPLLAGFLPQASRLPWRLLATSPGRASRLACCSPSSFGGSPPRL